MSRNEELHFSSNPTNIDIPRSKFKRNSSHKTTMSTGRLIPLLWDEILPGDTVKVDMASLVRMSTPIFPTMDNAHMDIYWFSVPCRLLWKHFKEFMGENNTSYWTQEVDYTIPQITPPSGGWAKGTLADYMGLPTGVNHESVSALPFRAYCKIYNDWFRSENLCEPLDVSDGDETTQGSNGNDEITDCQKGGMPVKVGRLADYFSSCLPQPQKGPDVYIPLGNSAPVVFSTPNKVQDASWTKGGTLTGQGVDTANWVNSRDQNSRHSILYGDTTGSFGEDHHAYSLETDLTSATASTINQLRQAFAVQRMYEKDALGGTRYISLIRQHFGVISPDARQQRAEYLGGKRININISQVLQTSSTDATSPQGNTAAYSLTIDNDDMFTKSFTEHEILMCVACVRTERTYQQGIERAWSRKTREQFYFPSLANLGNMPVYNREIYAQGNAEDKEVFGYQEAWAEYRYKNNIVSAEFRSQYAQSLDSWHYADDYNKLPVLGKEWFEETDQNVARTLAVQTQDQFLCDFYFDTTWTRPMPIYSIPGLIDHH